MEDRESQGSFIPCWDDMSIYPLSIMVSDKVIQKLDLFTKASGAGFTTTVEWSTERHLKN